MATAIVLILFFGGILALCYWKVESFRKLVKSITGSSGGSAVNPRQIETVKAKLARELERTKQLEEWAALQTKINTERAKQAQALKTIQGGHK